MREQLEGKTRAAARSLRSGAYPGQGLDGIPTIKEALGANISYNMLRGIFGPPDMPKEAVDWYVGFLKKIFDTKDFQDYLTRAL